MKLDLGPVRSTYVAPTFGTDVSAPLDPALERRLRRPMVVGAGIIGVLVIGLSLWASLTPLANGITAPGQVTVEANRKTIRHKETGTVRQILVKEGQLVKSGQPLLTFDDTDTRAALSILQNQADTLMAQVARLTAEATDRPTVTFAPELTTRVNDPTVAGLIRDQEFLFTSRLQLFQSQAQMLQQQLEQIDNQIRGDQAQLESAEEQRKLTVDEMSGYQTLYEKGYAPKQLILRYQRQVADLQGRKGSLLADIARLRQQMGETKMKLAALRDQRQSQAAEQLRDSQSKLEETLPRLVAAREAFNQSVVRSPADGYVFNLTQFTPGGVAGGGEPLMEIVPSNSPITVTVMIKPEDVDKVHAGMDARVRIVGPNPRWANPIPAKVAVVSADRITNKENGQAFFRADLHIDPKDLKDFEKNVKVTPGMTAQAMIVTGHNTIMGSLLQPITDTMRHALRDQ
jgi:HlyD family type I secretion membrane fusion protein